MGTARYGGEAEALEVVAGNEPGREVEADRFAVCHGDRSRTGREKNPQREFGLPIDRAAGQWRLQPHASGQPEAPAVLKQQCGLGKAAVADDGFADVGALTVEVFNSAASEHEVGVRLKLTPRAALALLRRLIAVQLILEDEHDHADSGDHLAHDDDADEVEVDWRVEADQVKDTQTGKRPGNEAEDAEEDAWGETTEDEDEQIRLSSGTLMHSTKVSPAPAP